MEDCRLEPGLGTTAYSIELNVIPGLLWVRIAERVVMETGGVKTPGFRQELLDIMY